MQNDILGGRLYDAWWNAYKTLENLTGPVRRQETNFKIGLEEIWREGRR
jgi:hypothetical protein